MNILSIWGDVREVLFFIDGIGFAFIDNLYNLFISIAASTLIDPETISKVLGNIYIVVGIFALFRIALFLINMIINPENFSKEKAGVSQIFINTVIMIVLLVLTPTAFSLSRDFAKVVVEGNYIQKIVTGTAGDTNTNPGKDMQRIAIGAVLTMDEAYVNNDGTYNGEGNGDVEDAYKCLLEIQNSKEDSQGCYSDTDKEIKWGKIASHNGSYKKIDGEKVYAFNYYPFVLLVSGIVICIVLGSFAFDVAKRMIELAVLEMISPLFIATYIDPKSSKSGPFKNWLTAVGKSYTSLFIRLAIISVMMLAIRLLSTWLTSDNGKGAGAIGGLIILIAFLMFCKSAPKWLEGLLGVEGGLGNGLWTPKKIAENMAGTKAIRTGAAVGGALAANRAANAAENHRRKQEARNSLSDDVKNKGRLSKDYRNAYREARKNNGGTVPRSIYRNLAGAGNAIKAGAKAGMAAGSMGAAIKGAADVNAKFKEKHAMGPGLVGKAKDALVGKASGVSTAAWGSDADIYNANKELEKTKNVKKFYNKEAQANIKPGDKDIINSGGAVGKLYPGVKNSDVVINSEGYKAFLKAEGATNIKAEVNKATGNVDFTYTDRNGVNQTNTISDSAADIRAYGYNDKTKEMGKHCAFTEPGIAFVKDKVNENQQSAISSTITAQQNITQLTTALNQANENIKSMNEEMAKSVSSAVRDAVTNGSFNVKMPKDAFAAALDSILPDTEANRAERQRLMTAKEQADSSQMAIPLIQDQMQQNKDVVDRFEGLIKGLKAANDGANKDKSLEELLVVVQNEGKDTKAILAAIEKQNNSDDKK